MIVGRMGMGEILVILIIALVIFGPKQLPKLGKTLGNALGQFKHYTDFSSNWDLDDDDDEDSAKKKRKKKTESVEKKAAGDVPDPIEKEAPAEEAAQAAETAQAEADAAAGADAEQATEAEA